MRTDRKAFWAAIVIVSAFIFFFAPAHLDAQRPVEAPRDAPIHVVKTYLRAIQARDFEAAYPYISSMDRSIRDKTTYLRSQERFNGFALDLSKRLAAGMKVWVIEQGSGSTKTRLKVGYRLPTGDEVATQLFDWNPDKLNALSANQQTAIVEALEKFEQSGKMITIEGRAAFDLVLEKDGWKIFLDWRSRQRVVFQSSQPRPAQLAVEFVRNDFLVQPAEPFQVDFKVSNRTDREMIVQLNHLVEPRQMEKNVDMIACGSRLPFRLRPRETQDISSAYLLRGNLPEGIRQLRLIYDFRILK